MAFALALAALGAAGCRSPAAEGEGRVVVLAAASLREAFTAIAADFERAHPGVEVATSFAGTQELRSQLQQGAKADVIAAADARQLEPLRAAGLVGEGAVFARNELVIVVPPGPSKVSDLATLTGAERLVLGSPASPIGGYTAQVLERADAQLDAGFRAAVEARVVSYELNVRQVLAKVELGEADAAIVYRSDATAAGARLRQLPIPPALNVQASYPIAVLRQAPHARLAAEFVALVRGPTGQAELARAGFLPAEVTP